MTKKYNRPDPLKDRIYRIDHHISPRAGDLLPIVSQLTGLLEQEVLRLLDLGAIYRNGKRAAGAELLESGDSLRIHCEPRRFSTAHVKWSETIFFSAPEFYIVNKPHGVPVHPTLDNAVENVLAQLSSLTGETLHITQRLDHGTRGLFVVARTKEFQAEFNGLLRERRVKKFYRALTQTAPSLGRHIHYMEPNPREPHRVFTEPAEDRFICELEVQSVARTSDQRFYVSQIELFTGRTHQIRTQLSQMGHPLVGDATYGSLLPDLPPGLQCERLEFPYGNARSDWIFQLLPHQFLEASSDFKDLPSKN